ncbi:MAG: hypothetical protein AAGF57_18630 [Pseudomonadota bacterium]
MKKPVTAFWGACVAAALMVQSAMASDQPDASAAVDAQAVTELFIIHAPSAALNRTAEGQLQLTLDQVDPTVMRFADRPVRRAAHMKIKAFLSAWDEGPNSFHNDPPNADFVSGTDQEQDIVFALSDPRWKTADQLQFNVKVVKGDMAAKTGNYQNVSLFLDSDILPCRTCDYADEPGDG